MVFSFGKYAGYPLNEIPASYLGLAVETFTLPEPLMIQCRGELLRRFGINNPNTPIVGTEAIDMRLKIKRTYRDLANKYHPDKGGTVEAMQALNDFHQALTQ